MIKRIFLATTLTLATLVCQADEIWHNLNYYVRVGYNLGGTAPIGMPATIRSLDNYQLCANFNLGIDAYLPFGNFWGIMAGLHFENKGMKTDARVKNYNMSMVQGGSKLSGVFTGNVITRENMSLITIPVQATLNISSHWRLKLGPYISYVTSHSFDGSAYNGYLRKDNPTGDKVMLGNEDDTRGNYNFSDNMRDVQWGIALGADWYASKRWGAFVGIDWGLSGIFKSDFHVISQTLYPIFGEIGVIYQLK